MAALARPTRPKTTPGGTGMAVVVVWLAIGVDRASRSEGVCGIAVTAARSTDEARSSTGTTGVAPASARAPKAATAIAAALNRTINPLTSSASLPQQRKVY